MKLLRNNILSFIVLILLFVGFGFALANTFPTTENVVEDGDVIESEMWNALETRIGANATTSKSTLTYQVNTLMATTSFPQLSTIGTITTGVWHGTSIEDAYIPDDITITGYLSLTSWYATTTNGLDEGSTNKYWSNTLWDNRMAASSSIASIITLSNLSITKSQVSDFGTYESVLTFNYPLSRATNAVSIVATSSMAIKTSDLVESGSLFYTDARSRAAISSSATGLTYTSATGDFSLTSGYLIPTTAMQTSWNNKWDLASSTIANTSLTNSTIGLTSSGSITIGTSLISLGGTSALNLNMAQANTWTELQTFTNASTTGTLTINQICNGLGECWDTPGFEGSQVNFYPNNDTSEIGIYEDMLTYPKGAVAIDESCGADSDIAGGYCTIDTYISTTTDIAILNYPAGLTRIRAYTYVDSPSGISKLEFNGYKRDSAGVESYIGQATTTEINSASVAEFIANFIGLTDFPFNSDGTDRLVMVVKGWTDSNQAKTIHWTYQNNNYYSHFESPITIADEGLARTYADETITGNWTHTGKLTMGNASTTQIGSTGSAYFATSNGNVGIGTTTPGALLHVAGNIRLSGNLLDTNGNIIFAPEERAGAVNYLTVRSGETGVGTGIFAIGADTNISLNLRGKGTGGVWIDDTFANSFEFHGSAASGATMKTTAGDLILKSASVEGLRIQSTTGNVGIGTTSPYSLLSVGGDVVVGASTAGGTLGDLYLPKLGVAAGTFLAVDATGKVIATTTPAGGTGLTSLNSQTGSTQTFATSSDTNIGLTITSTGDVHTFTSNWIGTLAAARIGLLSGFTDASTIAGGDRFPFYQDTSGANRDISWTNLMGEITNTGTLADLTVTGATTLATSLSGLLGLNTGVTYAVSTSTLNIGGNAGTATALASNPTDCGAGTKAISIDASGNLTCSAVDISADTNLAAGRSLTMSGDSVEADAELYTEPLASFNIGSSTMSTTTGTFMGKKIPVASTITGVACDTDIGTSTINCDIRAAETPNVAGTNISNGGFLCGSGAGQTASTTIASTAITALQTINCNIPDASPVGGTKPSIIHIYIYGTKND
jgi:hypothetical protein